LETRFCPAAPVINSLAATPQPGHLVTISGTVSDDHSNTLQIILTGAASGTASATVGSTSGTFSFTTSTATLGTVYAVATDDQNATSPTCSVDISVAAPVVSVSVQQRANKQVSITGTVTGVDAATSTVTITGVASGTTTTNSSGAYSVTLTASALGNITASNQDTWGQTGNATATLTNAAPSISFQATQGNQGNWTFSGTVTDEYAPGLTVRFTSLIAAVNNLTAVVQSGGTFSCSVTIPNHESGGVTAGVSDWWGEVGQASQWVFNDY
jgi:hypothetical protein